MTNTTPPHTGLIRFLDECWGKVKRFLLVKLRPAAMRASVSRRKGECRRCGACCSIAFRCPSLRERNQCAIYETRYEQCRWFPIDARDLKYLGDTCGFYFEDETPPDASEIR